MKKSPLSIVLMTISLMLLFPQCSPAPSISVTQRAIDQITYTDFPEGFPKHDPEFSDTILHKLDKEELRLSIASHKLLQIGQYQKVNSINDLALNWGLDSLAHEELKLLEQFRFVDAYQEILDQAKEHEMLIITESHTKPNHRVFISQLLKGLYKIGYRAIGLENIQAKHKSTNGALLDSQMVARGYPLLSGISGIYTSESHYANIIRQATAIGFDVFAYERNGSSDAERDQQQAEHILQYREDHPNQKIICYGGWYHAIEAPIKKRGKEGDFWMAYELKLLSQLDPLTVYLDAFNEKTSKKVKSSPYYDFLIDKLGNPAFPVVLKDQQGSYYRGIDQKLPFDILVVSPKDKYNENGLPKWLNYYSTENGWNFYDFSDQINSISNEDFPIIFKIQEAFSSDIATPIHCYELTNKVNAFNLPVNTNEVRIVILNKAYEKIVDNKIALK